MSRPLVEHEFNDEENPPQAAPVSVSCPAMASDAQCRAASPPAKRQRLKEIVERLGPEATPGDIREEAYRVGFGPVNTQMLIWVRNELWPRRSKRPGGRTPDAKTTILVQRAGAGELRCPSCGSHALRIRSLYRQPDGNIRRYRVCSSCGHKFHCIEANNPGRLHIRRRLAMAAAEKECATCKRVLPVCCFSKKANDAHLYRSSCRDCLNQKRADHYLTKVLERYGLTILTYQEMLEAQGGRCAICRSDGADRAAEGPARYRFLRIDHYHETGSFRGLLCDKCNLGIGNFNDEPERLEAAAAYLRERPSQGACHTC